jgi:para-nitrobenzyl esterase
MASAQVWRGVRFAHLAHRFAVPEQAPPRRVPAPGGTFGPAPWQTVGRGFDPGAPLGDDCLWSNICVPDGPPPPGGLPVLVWFYGGGFESGSASAGVFDGAALAAEVPCIVVTPNYRLGAIGFGMFSHHGGLLAGAHDLGVRDAIAAIRWVCDEIGAFGGDASRITVAGQSAGGFLACAALAAPQCPTVRSAVFLSGGASRISGERDARELGEQVLGVLGLGSKPERIIGVPGPELVAAQQEVAPTDLAVRNGPVPRGLGIAMDASCPDPVVPVPPMTAIAGGQLAATGILSGATVDEMDGFDPLAVGREDRALPPAERDRDAVGPLDPARIAAYRDDADTGRRRRRLMTDYVYRLPAARLVTAQRNAGGRAALTEFPRSANQGLTAGHGADLGALFSPPEDAAPERDRVLHRVFADLIATGALPDGDLDAPAVAGADYPDDVLRPDRLVRLWRGVDRP